MKFGHCPTDRFGQRLRHLVETFSVRDVDAGKLDGDRRGCYRAQLAHWSGDGRVRRAFKALYEYGLYQKG
jgi:hypothetical protein